VPFPEPEVQIGNDRLLTDLPEGEFRASIVGVDPEGVQGRAHVIDVEGHARQRIIVTRVGGGHHLDELIVVIDLSLTVDVLVQVLRREHLRFEIPLPPLVGIGPRHE